MFLGFFLGFILGLIISFICVMNDVNKVEDERHNAELRALTHFRKLFKIEQIIKESDDKKENHFITIDKIKEVISSDQTNK